MTQKKRIAEHYDKESLVYDKIRYKEDTQYVRIDEEVCHILLKYLTGNSVLELGAGTGRYGIFLNEHGYSWKGIDISKGMIKVAKEKAKKVGINLEMICGDVEDSVLYEQARYDNVICVRAFNFFPTPLKVIENVYKTLKEGGRFILFYYNKDNFFGKISSVILSRPYFDKDDNFLTLYTFNDMWRILSKFDFKIIYKRDITNFPHFIYAHFPRFVNLRIVKKIDNLLKGGWVTVVVAEKQNKR